MSKLILVSVVAAGCVSRFRNGMQFTNAPTEIEVDDSELAVLEADRHLQVKVLLEGADDDDTGKDTAFSSVVNSLSKDVPPDDTIILSAKASVIVDELESEPAPKADADAGTTTPPKTVTSEAKSAEVSKAPIDHLETIVEAMRGSNLDMSAGKPTVNELKALGLDISAKERDAAWDALVK